MTLRPSCFPSQLVAIITARPELLLRAEELEPGLSELFVEPRVLTGKFGGRTGMSFEEYTRRAELKVKALYLASMQGYPSDSAVRGYVDALLGPLPVPVEVFDRWWTLELREVDGSVELLIDEAQRKIDVTAAGEDWFDEWARSVAADPERRW